MHRLWIHFFLHAAYPYCDKSINFSQIINWAIVWLLSVSTNIFRVTTGKRVQISLRQRPINALRPWFFKQFILFVGWLSKIWFFYIFLYWLCWKLVILNIIKTEIILYYFWFNKRFIDILNFIKFYLIRYK